MIAFDTSAVLCFVEKIEPPCTPINRMIVAADDRSIISSLTMTECLIHPIRRGDIPLRELYNAYFSALDLRIQSVTKAIALLASDLNANVRLRAPDAIHLATAIVCGAEKFVTTDFDDFGPCVGRVPIQIELIVRYPHQQPPQ